MNIKFMAKTLLVLSMLTTLSFAGEGHGNSKHNMNHTDKSEKMMKMDDDMKMDKMDDMNDDSGMMMKKSGNKPSKMSCGAGKCAPGKCGGK